MHMSIVPPRRRGSVGYALLEALIAVIVAAVGFIGAARMQTFGMKLGNSAQWRQKATLLGYQMTDRLRANQAGVAKDAYSLLTSGDRACLDLVAGCTEVQLASADFFDWSQEVAAQLPGGRGVVCKDSTPEDGAPAAPACDGLGSVYAVKVWWGDKVPTTTDVPALTRFVTVIRPWNDKDTPP